MIYGIIYAAPSPDLEHRIFIFAGTVLLIGCVVAAIWVKFVMKRGLFEPETIKRAIEN